MQFTSDKFQDNVKTALKQPNLRIALDRTTGLLIARRRETIAQYPEYAEARATAERIKRSYARQPRSLPGDVREECDCIRRQGLLGRDAKAGDRYHHRHLPEA